MKYTVIYADPPWRLGFSLPSRGIEKHYPTMELQDIFEFLKVNKIKTKKNAVLFLWATAPLLKEALRVMYKWGFKYRTNLIWDKMKIGCGYWFRGQHEILLVGTKGKISPPDRKMRISSVYHSMRRKHSRKPDYIREQISKWYPNFRKIELFARQRFEGWHTIGNEVPKDIQSKLKRRY